MNTPKEARPIEPAQRDPQVTCARCRNKHKLSERPLMPGKDPVLLTRVCPRCAATEYIKQ